MQKIVIDTNVIVSSLIQWSYQFKIVFKVLNTI
jgi:predicted nucleic acid-binding protein